MKRNPILNMLELLDPRCVLSLWDLADFADERQLIPQNSGNNLFITGCFVKQPNVLMLTMHQLKPQITDAAGFFTVEGILALIISKELSNVKDNF
jgi:hypothetical protein